MSSNALVAHMLSGSPRIGGRCAGGRGAGGRGASEPRPDNGRRRDQRTGSEHPMKTAYAPHAHATTRHQELLFLLRMENRASFSHPGTPAATAPCLRVDKLLISTGNTHLSSLGRS